MSPEITERVARFLTLHSEARNAIDKCKVRARELSKLASWSNDTAQERERIDSEVEWIAKRVEYLSVESTALILLSPRIPRVLAGLSIEQRVKELKKQLAEETLKYIHQDLNRVYGNPDARKVVTAIVVHMPLFDVYDPAYHHMSHRQLSEAVATITAVSGWVNLTPQILEALVKLYLYLTIWHGSPPNADQMNTAIEELKHFGIPLDVDKMAFGPTTEIGSELWDDECTLQYWNGDMYATPHGAAKAQALISSQVQGAGVFGRDALVDAGAVAKLFGGNLAVAATE